MAAYAAALSLMHIMDLLKNHPSPPISLDKQQFDSLTEIVTFLQEFLEGYVSPFSYSDEADPLEMRIAEAVHAAEDVIESYIVETVHLAAASTTQDDHSDGDIDHDDYYGGYFDVDSGDNDDDEGANDDGDDDDGDEDDDDYNDSDVDSGDNDDDEGANDDGDDDDDGGDEDDEPDPLEMRIAEAVYAAEDTIHLDVDDDDGDEDDEPDPLEMRIAEAVYAAEDTIHLDVDDDDGDEDDETDPLEMQIAEAVYAVEDTIHLDADDDDYDDDVAESYTLDSIQLAAAAAHQEDEQIRYFNFYEGLQKVMEAMGLIKKEAMVEMEMAKGRVLEAELQGNVLAEGGIKSSFIERKSEMVGFDDEVLQLKERLVGGDSSRQIIPIVGMGGIGKTTLARNVFAGKLIKEHFDICMWATISQDHNIQESLREVLSQSQGRGHSGGDKGVEELGEELYKYLSGRRYLVVLDDMWSIEVWDKMRYFFPDCGQGCRVIVTTRMSNLAAHLTNSSNSICKSFLNEVDSWTLFCKTVFGSEGSVSDPQLELAEIGKKIVGKCKGLPLSIVVIGGLLANSERTQAYWKYVERNLSSIVNSENEEYCLRVLKLSYNHLPAYLKPCILYMGVFEEDRKIKISTIIKLWVSEGFIKPSKEKNLEKVAREYFQELVDRNLLIALSDDELRNRDLGSFGMANLCKMHDLIRDLSRREAQKQRFYHVYSEEHDPSSHPHRRIVIDNAGTKLESSPTLRSYVCHDDRVGVLLNFRMLRTLHSQQRWRQEDVFGLVNARLLSFNMSIVHSGVLDSSISRLWSLHTLINSKINSKYTNLEGPVEFWNMHQLKHVEFAYGGLRLYLPPSNDNNIVILENLHTLIGMKDLYLNEDVVKRIPNLAIFYVKYESESVNRELHCLSYLQRLSKLESFRCDIRHESGVDLQRICFPQSLNQIHLCDFRNPEWDGILAKIGQLAFVQDLVIRDGYFQGNEWETTEGQFPRLSRLELEYCDLEKWIVPEASHFPLLQKIVLVDLANLEEIPSEVGEIATLKSIEVHRCSRSAVLSAKKIVEEQEDLYGEEELSFHVLVIVDIDNNNDNDSKELESLASANFTVELE